MSVVYFLNCDCCGVLFGGVFVYVCFWLFCLFVCLKYLLFTTHKKDPGKTNTKSLPQASH